MGDPMVMKGWNMHGLPSDGTSLENGILVTNAERWGLCIDPQEQANKWLKSMLKSDNLQILKVGPPTLLRDVTGCVRNGLPVLLEDLEEIIDPALDPILLHQEFVADGGIKQIKLGDAIVDYDGLFKLFMTTKMPNPHYSPEICIKVTLINFTVTQEGLEEQLLVDVVKKERPDVEEKRDQIVVQMDTDNRTLKKIEINILKLLNDSELEQILDEDTLINVLDQSKITSNEINERIA
jgi:dynein heavy chain